jgi:hypothetical protein
MNKVNLADKLALVLLLEPAGTLNTGNLRDTEKTAEVPERI